MSKDLIVFGSPEAAEILAADKKILTWKQVEDLRERLDELDETIEDLRSELIDLEFERRDLEKKILQSPRIEDEDDGEDETERELTAYDLRKWNEWASGKAAL